MSITDELRERAKMLTHWWYDPVKDEYTYTTYTMPPSIDAIRLDSSIIAIADRIDAEHESACAEAYGNGVMSVPIALDESVWVELPKDADGEYIHIGDKLIDEDDKLQKPAIVKCILYNDEGCVVSDIDPRGCWYDPSLLRHHHAPSVEDVLREFAYGLGVPVADSYVAATAAKLRLAEGEDA